MEHRWMQGGVEGGGWMKDRRWATDQVHLIRVINAGF